jgi:hypothetical protein
MITDRMRAEVVECASPNCSNLYERPVGVRGRPQRYCSRLCGNFARLMLKAAAQPQFRPFTYAPAQNRAAQPIHETDAHAAGGAVNYAHDHEVLRHSPIEPVTGATAHSTASNKQQPTNKHAQKQGRENL